MRRVLFLCLLWLSPALVTAQYAPQATIAGSTAIPAASAAFSLWANSCTVQRGWLNIAVKDSGTVSAGVPENGTGMPDGSIVSLGDSGVAVLAFPAAMYDGPGPDFAVFENGFANALNPEEAFLELAFVEVSSDGINFVRFPSISLTQDTQQISSIAGESYLNARLLNNLAGKYTGGYGVPFDLAELSAVPGLDVAHITHIRLVDAVGSIAGNATTDSAGRAVNDPYPTPFPTGGFDLDAVGILHSYSAGISANPQQARVLAYPNPTTGQLNIDAPSTDFPFSVSVRSVAGGELYSGVLPAPGSFLDVSRLPSGQFFVILTSRQYSCVLSFVHVQ